MRLYRLVRFCFRFIFPLITRWRVTGVENVPLQGRLIVASNHVHILDPFILAVAVPRLIYFMGKVEVFQHPLTGWFTRRVQGIPVRRGEVDRRALRKAVATLKEEKVLGIFPEGTRSLTGQLQRGRDGMTLIALRADATILPVSISGSDQIVPFLRQLRRAEVVIAIGEPLRPPVVEGRVPRPWIAGMTDRLMRRIAVRLPLVYRGIYRDV